MISGDLNARGLPVITVRVKGPFGLREFTSFVDTCFGSNLSVPDEVAWSLGLRPLGILTLAGPDGVPRTFRTCRCEVFWEERWRPAEVVLSPNALSLVGARLLHGHRLTVDYGPARTVTIE